jgi:hypothetical protein
VARAKSRTKREAKRPRTKAVSRKTASKKTASGKTASKRKGSESDVEKRWSAYWQRRNDLEEAVAKVREAREALASFVEIERSRRAEFEQVKASLTELLDVEPAVQSRPVAVPSEPREAGARAKG